MSTKSNVRKESKFVRYMKGPIKILARARDFYVQRLTACANQAAYAGAMSCPTFNPASLSRSFSANESYNSNNSYRDEDMRELVRISSTRGLTGKSEAQLLRPRKSPRAPAGGGGAASAVIRCRTVGIGRIDEDEPYEFGGNDVGGWPVVYPRSRSYAASGRSKMV